MTVESKTAVPSSSTRAGILASGDTERNAGERAARSTGSISKGRAFSISAMRTLRAKGERGREQSFLGMGRDDGATGCPRHKGAGRRTPALREHCADGAEKPARRARSRIDGASAGS